MRVHNTMAAAALVGAVLGAMHPAIADTYTVHKASLSGTSYTNSSFPFARWTPAGYVAGTSTRVGSGQGSDAWSFNPTDFSVTQVGLFNIDDNYQAVSGSRVSSITMNNNTGGVVGNSNRYSPGTSTQAGQDAWYFNGTTTVAVGPHDSPLYMASNSPGYFYNNATGINAQNVVIGFAYIFNGGTATAIPSQNQFRNAFYYNPNDAVPAPVIIGLDGPTHTNSSTGFGNANALFISDNNLIAGVNTRFNGALAAGSDAWLYKISDGSYTPLGLTGASYEKTDGTRSSSVNSMTDGGYTFGTSARFVADVNSGADAWAYNPVANANYQIGLTGPGFENGNFRQSGVTSVINNVGGAAGTSFRYSGGSQVGQSAWVYKDEANPSVEVGLTGGIYEQPSGSRSSTPNSLNNTGQAAGSSSRYNNTTQIGTDVWFYNPNSPDANKTKMVSLAGPISGTTYSYDRPSDNARNSSVSFLNDNGLLGGFTARYNDASASIGNDAWVYDANTDITYTLHFSENSTGNADARIDFITPDDIVLGRYTRYEGDVSQGNFAFLWTETGGLVDLNLQTDNLADDGWLRLTEGIRMSDTGQIIGLGNLAITSSNTTVFALSPTPVPEPAALSILGVGAMALLASRRRR